MPGDHVDRRRPVEPAVAGCRRARAADLTASSPQENQQARRGRTQPPGRTCGQVAIAAARSHRGALLALRARELDRRRQQHRLQRGQPRRRGSDRQHRARAVGAAPVEEVVVHLHHDPAAGQERHAGPSGSRSPPQPGAQAATQPRVVSLQPLPPLVRRCPCRRSTANPARRAPVETLCLAQPRAGRRGTGSRDEPSSACRGRSAPRSRTRRPSARVEEKAAVVVGRAVRRRGCTRVASGRPRVVSPGAGRVRTATVAADLRPASTGSRRCAPSGESCRARRAVERPPVLSDEGGDCGPGGHGGIVRA